ncbi:hypothetical protein [Microbacterium sp. CGR1]|nr:hypothetical protein [Microbacterium sp. CGR1]
MTLSTAAPNIHRGIGDRNELADGWHTLMRSIQAVAVDAARQAI